MGKFDIFVIGLLMVAGSLILMAEFSEAEFQYTDEKETENIRLINSFEEYDKPKFVCTYNYYNCPDFSTYREAREVFDYCKSQGQGDIHWLDGDDDGIPCEALW